MTQQLKLTAGIDSSKCTECLTKHVKPGSIHGLWIKITTLSTMTGVPLSYVKHILILSPRSQKCPWAVKRSNLYIVFWCSYWPDHVQQWKQGQCLQDRPAGENEQTWELSRFNPMLQEILEDLVSNNLSSDEYPYVRPPSAGTNGIPPASFGTQSYIIMNVINVNMSMI